MTLNSYCIDSFSLFYNFDVIFFKKITCTGFFPLDLGTWSQTMKGFPFELLISLYTVSFSNKPLRAGVSPLSLHLTGAQ
jgi:hypothetical protein